MRLHGVVMQPNARSPLDPVWVIIFGHELGPFPYPVHLVEPTAHRFCSNLNAVLGLERRREGGTTPPGAALAIGTWGPFEQRTKGAQEPRHQDGHPHGDRELTVWGNAYAETPTTICPHDTVHAGARAKQEGRHLRRVAARRTQQ